MARVTENPRKYIVSCRVDLEEMYVLQERAQKLGISITGLLRACLNLSETVEKRQTVELEAQACR